MSGIYLSIVGILFASAFLMDKTKKHTARGLRNNNPGNLIITDIAWLGKVPRHANTDGKFEQFVKPEYGIRALYRDVTGDIERDGSNTIRKLLREYSATDQAAYIDFVSKKLGISPDEFIDSSLYIPLVGAIIQFENGANPYDAEFIKRSILLNA